MLTQKIEGLNFDVRKHLLDYDDVMNTQRTVMYDRRRKILFGSDAEVAEMELEAGLAAQAQQDRETAEAAKAAAAASAVTKLEAIGLTAEEIAALRG